MKKFLNQNELAERLGIADRTLEAWRWKGVGPAFHRIGGSVRYSIDDIEAYERLVRN
ncbi:helix-turn-helix transcriptional regulator [Sphingomonas sp.]|uniref:helix-turn-helix transcriptional regulator n=1 Tax=Sphingomonas sp. TaxID=28214 RepID=UPI003AFF7362